MAPSYILVTGATGLVGGHVVENLLKKGMRVRAMARSKQKAEQLVSNHLEYRSNLDICFADDLTTAGAFDEAVKGVDGVIHIASPLKYDVEDREKELIVPAVQGVRSLLEASLHSNIQRIVMTSSFGAVLDMTKDEAEPWTYTAEDWNPMTYDEAVGPQATPQDAYRGSKIFAEQEAWNFIKTQKAPFSLVTLCPSMVFGPIASSQPSVSQLNESNALLWKVYSQGPNQPLPPCRFNFWIDVRDLAEVHVQALMNPAAAGKRYIPVAPEGFTYQKASEIMSEEFSWAKGHVSTGEQKIKEHVRVDSEPMSTDFPTIQFKTFRETVIDFANQISQKSISKCP